MDPYTKESLGTTESEVGLIEITRVDSKVSYAKVLSGEEFAVGMVARPDASAAATAGRAKKVENRRKKTGVIVGSGKRAVGPSAEGWSSGYLSAPARILQE